MTITNQTILSNSTLTPRQQLEELCQRDPSVSIFLNPFWLDIVCKNGTWDACLSYDNVGEIDGVLVCFKVKLKGLISAIAMPELTPNAGVWLRLPNHKINGIKRHSVYTATKKIIESLLLQLPNVPIYCQHFHYSLTDWQPFFWRNYRQTTHYSYIIDNLYDLPTIFSELKGSVRTDLKKAERLVTIKTTNESDENNLSEFYDVVNLSFRKQGMKPLYSLEMLRELDTVLGEKNARQLFLARDIGHAIGAHDGPENADKGTIHGGVYIIIWNGTAHYIAGGSHPELRQSGAMSLLIWRAIEWAAAQGCHTFDFEGSMIPQVETLFRAFGGQQKPFFRITKTRNLLYDLLTLFFPNYR
jgi:Acetyltransferase (GNAT) domain